jgi:hypothetical protein
MLARKLGSAKRLTVPAHPERNELPRLATTWLSKRVDVLEAWEPFGARKQETEACTYDTGSLGCRPLAVSSNERVRGLWLVTRNKITGGPPPLNLFGGKPSARGGATIKKRDSLPQSNLKASHSLSTDVLKEIAAYLTPEAPL